MATFSAVFSPAGKPTKVSALGATSSSAELDFYNGAIVAIEASGDVNVVFGNSGMAAADATGWAVWGKQPQTFDLGDQFSAMRIYNPGASAVDVYILPLVKA